MSTHASQRAPCALRLRLEDQSLAADLPARRRRAHLRLVARRQTPRLRAGQHGHRYAATTASGSVSRMPTARRGGMCRIRKASVERRARRCWSSSAPPARPGRPTARSSPSSPIGRASLRATPVSRGSGSARSPAAASSKWRRDTGRLHDLHWSPRGDKLGLVRSGSEARPILAAATPPTESGTGADSRRQRRPSTSGAVPAVSPARSTRARSAGSPAGAPPATTWRTSCPDDVLGAEDPLWSFLLVPDPLARDAVVIADGDGAGQGCEEAGVLRTARHVPALVAIGERRGALALVYLQPVAPLGALPVPGGRAAVGRPGGALRRADRQALVDGRQPPRGGADRPLPPDQTRVRRRRGSGTSEPMAALPNPDRKAASNPEPESQDRDGMAGPAVFASRNRGLPVPLPDETGPT